MKNVTISLDDETGNWAEVEAARRGTSISRFVAGLVRDWMVSDQSYEVARGAYLAEPARDLNSSSGTYPPRDDLHSR